MANRTALLLAVLMLVGCDNTGDVDPDSGTRPDAAFDGGGLAPDASVADTGPPRDGAPGDGATLSDSSREDGGMALARVREELCRPLATALCTSPWECGCRDASSRPSDEAACIDAEMGACVTSFVREGPGGGLASGDVRFDDAALARCGAFVERAYADCTATTDDFLAVCLAAFASRAPLGSPCAGGTLCADGDGFCAEVCIALPRAGERCEGFPPLCARGLTCRAGVCGSPGAMGERCALESDCSEGLHCLGEMCRPFATTPCTDTVECAPGQRCTGGSCVAASDLTCEGGSGCPSLSECIADSARRCAARASIGGFCDGVDVCVEDAVCDFSASRCVRAPVVDERCDGQCAAGLLCAFDTGTCVVPPAEGALCRSAFASTGCEDGLGCFSGTCRRLSGEGSACADGGECVDGLVCVIDAGGNVCAGPRGDGDRCDDGIGDPCAASFYCDRATGVCAARGGSGTSCDFDACLPGLECMFDDVGRGSCRALPAIGEDCGRACAGEAVCTDVPLGGVCRPRVCDNYPTFDR